MVSLGRRRSGESGHCLVCRTEIYSHPSRIKKFCSIPCRDTHKRAQTVNDEAGTKKCTLCGEWKPFDAFSLARGTKASKLGRQGYCRLCSTKKSKEWATKNPLKRAAITAASCERQRGRPKTPRTQAQREADNAARREWGKKNREKTRDWNKRRTHRQRAGGDLPPKDDINAMMCGQDGRCTYCDGPLKKYHIDHKTPVSRGGTNDAGNLQLLCPTCNMRKGARTHEEYSGLLSVKTGGWKKPWWQWVC